MGDVLKNGKHVTHFASLGVFMGTKGLSEEALIWRFICVSFF